MVSVAGYGVGPGVRNWHKLTQRWIWAADRSCLPSSQKRDAKRETYSVRNSVAGSKYVISIFRTDPVPVAMPAKIQAGPSSFRRAPVQALHSFRL